MSARFDRTPIDDLRYACTKASGDLTTLLGEVVYLRTKIAELGAKDTRIALLEELLKRCEWVEYGNSLVNYCSICGAFGEIPEHAPDCELAAALRDGGAR